MTSLDDILKQQQLLELMINNFILSQEESDTSTEEQTEALKVYTANWESQSCELEAKINAYGWAIRKLDSEEVYYRNRAKEATDKAKAKAVKSAFLRKRLEAFLADMPQNKFTTMDFNLRMQNNPPSLEINDSYEGDIPDEYIKEQKPADYLDKGLVKAALKNGVTLPFARLTVSRSIRGV